MVSLHSLTLDGIVYPAGYRVVTAEMRSLGLRHNPTILTYALGEWVTIDKPIAGKGDVGGIWVARTPGRARAYQKYMHKMYGQPTRAFRAALGDILFANHDRIKTDRILLLDELFL